MFNALHPKRVQRIDNPGYTMLLHKGIQAQAPNQEQIQKCVCTLLCLFWQKLRSVSAVREDLQLIL